MSEPDPALPSGLAELYFAPKAFESPALYRALGVGVAQRVVVWLGRRTGRDPTRPNNYFVWDRSPQGLRAFEKKTRSNELMHLAGMILPALALAQGADGVLGVVLALILLLTVYPVLLQRYNRARIYRVLAD